MRNWQRLKPGRFRRFMPHASLLPPAAFFATAAFAADFDVLIQNARIADGTGSALQNGSVGIQNGRITALGDVKGTATKTIDAHGLVVAPGFIDVHTHSEDICQNPVAENFLRMGVTTIITGNCGYSRTDVGTFFQEIEAAKPALNVATLIGHGSVRKEGMGGSFIRAPGEEQLKRCSSSSMPPCRTARSV